MRTFVFFVAISSLLASEPISELDTLRAIAARDKATMADLCNALAVQRGELANFATTFERCENLTAQGIYNFAKVSDLAATEVTLGNAMVAALNANNVEKTMMFRLTRLEWYAMQNAEGLQLVKPKSIAAKKLSGRELLGLLEKAHAAAGDKAEWGNEKNPYEVFGVKSYKELSENDEKK